MSWLWSRFSHFSGRRIQFANSHHSLYESNDLPRSAYIYMCVYTKAKSGELYPKSSLDWEFLFFQQFWAWWNAVQFNQIEGTRYGSCPSIVFWSWKHISGDAFQLASVGTYFALAGRWLIASTRFKDSDPVIFGYSKSVRFKQHVMYIACLVLIASCQSCLPLYETCLVLIASCQSCLPLYETKQAMIDGRHNPCMYVCLCFVKRPNDTKGI